MCLQTVLVERPSASDFESVTLCWTLFEPSETPLLCGVFSPRDTGFADIATGRVESRFE